MTNPLLAHHKLPPFDQIRPEHMHSAVAELLVANRAVVENLLKGDDRSWDGFFRQLEENDDRLAQAFGPVSHLNSVMNSASVREAHDACLPLLSDYYTEMKQNPKLYAAYQDMTGSDEYRRLDVASRKVIENAIRDFRLSGVDLPPDRQHRFAEISRRLSELSSQFNNHVLDATMAWTRLVTDADDLAGLPEQARSEAEERAREREEQGFLLTLDLPCYLPMLTYCENQRLRQDLYEAYATRASDQGPNAGEYDNSAVMEEILTLRQEQARLLGFDHYGARSLATKMARSTDEVLAFLRDLAARARPRAVEEFEELAEFAREQFGIESLEAWDIAFYSEKLKQSRFQISDDELRPYFPADRVIQGMFETVQRLYDLEIRAVSDIETWHEDVTTYNVHRSGTLIARFYLDPYTRQHKQGGAWMDDCRVRRIRLDGSLQLPVAYLNCNFSRPAGGKPSLLTHDDVVTLFHEFGHGLHHMLTRVDCADVSGINGVAWDAVELPSQFMENWCWQPEALAFISGHVDTGEPLPPEMLDKMLAARNFQAAMATVRQLEFALFDLRMHTEYDGTPGQVQRILDEVRQEVAVFHPPGYHRFQHAFSHIFGGGYAAGYYSYKWAEVLSADAFARFKEDGIFNRQTGERFLESVLEKGGSVDAMDLFVEFRGREPDAEALLRQDGIA